MRLLINHDFALALVVLDPECPIAARTLVEAALAFESGLAAAQRVNVG